MRITAFISFYTLSGIVLLLSCHQKPQPPETIAPVAVNADKASRRKPAATYQDTLIINQPAAVFYEPDSLQLARIRAITDSGIFIASLHEYDYQFKTAKAYFKKYRPGLPLLQARNVRYLLFRAGKATPHCIDLNEKGDAYGLILFTPGKTPHQVDMPNIDTEAPTYYNNPVE